MNKYSNLIIDGMNVDKRQTTRTRNNEKLRAREKTEEIEINW